MSWVRIPSSTLKSKAPYLTRCGAFDLLAWRDSKPRHPEGGVGKLRVTQQLAPMPHRHLCEGTTCTASGMGGGPRGGIPSSTLRGGYEKTRNPPAFLFTPLTCLRYACRRRVRFPLQSALMTPNWVKTTLCRHSVALCTSTVTLSPPQCPETPITYWLCVFEVRLYIKPLGIGGVCHPDKSSKKVAIRSLCV